MKRIMPILNKISYFIGCLTITIICGAIVAQVINRFVFNGAFQWTDEICQMMLVAMVFTGMGLVEQNNEQIKMDIIYQIFPRRRFIIDFVLKVTTVAFLIVMLYSEYLLFPSVKGVVAKASQIPIIYVHFAMIGGLLFWLLSTIVGVIDLVNRKKACKETGQ